MVRGNREEEIVGCALRIEICIEVLNLLFQLIHQRYLRLVFQKALVAYFPVCMFPLSNCLFETAAYKRILNFVQLFINILQISPA
jgi:hypothetical protein